MKDFFIGKSCLNKSTEFSGARDEVIWNGNINLLEVENKKYIFIRDCVYSFNTDDKLLNMHLMWVIMVFLLLLLTVRGIYTI